jgi:hypothetical protein
MLYWLTLQYSSYYLLFLRKHNPDKLNKEPCDIDHILFIFQRQPGFGTTFSFSEYWFLNI